MLAELLKPLRIGSFSVLLLATLVNDAEGQFVRKDASVDIDVNAINVGFFSRDAKLLVVPRHDGKKLDRSSAEVWDTATGKKLGELNSDVEFVQSKPPFAADGARLFGQFRHRGSIELWHLFGDDGASSYRRVAEFPIESSVTFCEVSDKAQRGVAATDQTCHVYDLGKRERIASFPLRTSVAACSSNLKLIATRAHQDVDLYDLLTGKEQASLVDHPGEVQGVSFGPEDKYLAVLSCRTNEFGGDAAYFIRIWDVATVRQVAQSKPFKEYPLRLQFISTTNLLAIFAKQDRTGNFYRFLDWRRDEWTEPQMLPRIVEGDHLYLGPNGVFATSGKECKTQIWQVVSPR